MRSFSQTHTHTHIYEKAHYVHRERESEKESNLIALLIRINGVGVVGALRETQNLKSLFTAITPWSRQNERDPEVELYIEYPLIRQVCYISWFYRVTIKLSTNYAITPVEEI